MAADLGRALAGAFTSDGKNTCYEENDRIRNGRRLRSDIFPSSTFFPFRQREREAEWGGGKAPFAGISAERRLVGVSVETHHTSIQRWGRGREKVESSGPFLLLLLALRMIACSE